MKRLQPGVLLLLGLAACDGVYSDPQNAPAHDALPHDAAHDAAPVDGQIVFTTSKAYRGGLLGGVEGADAICADHASQAGLAGEFKAWISQLDNSAADRLTHSTRPYVLVGGIEVAASWDDLLRFDLQHAIDHDEHGAALTLDPTYGDPVWSATLVNGHETPWTPGGDSTSNPRRDCTLWSSITGGVGMLGAWGATGTSWTSTGSGIPCTSTARLYCFQQ